MSIVKNIYGTSNNTCKCDSWLSHWEKFSGKIAGMCSKTNCLSDENLVGAHVKLVNSQDDSWYIAPLCGRHNQMYEAIDIGRVTLVSANVSETCGS